MTDSRPVLDLTDPANPCLSPAFLGYRIDTKRGQLFWAVCAWCSGKEVVEREAARLGVEITHGLCPTCAAALIAKHTGDRT